MPVCSHFEFAGSDCPHTTAVSENMYTFEKQLVFVIHCVLGICRVLDEMFWKWNIQ